MLLAIGLTNRASKLTKCRCSSQVFHELCMLQILFSILVNIAHLHANTQLPPDGLYTDAGLAHLAGPLA